MGILEILVAVLIVCVAYYITLRITADTTFAFLVGVVVAITELAYRGLLG